MACQDHLQHGAKTVACCSSSSTTTSTVKPWLRIILDIDGTLICERTMMPRPFLGEFLQTCFATCASVSLWTAASRWWLDKVEREVLRPLLREDQHFDLRWSQERCTLAVDRKHIAEYGGFYVLRQPCKPLRKLWRRRNRVWTRNNTLIVDDTPRTYSRNYGNAVPVPTWAIPITSPDPSVHDLSNQTFQLLSQHVHTLATRNSSEVHLRSINKRQWCTVAPNPRSD